jgi:hypothetical protein
MQFGFKVLICATALGSGGVLALQLGSSLPSQPPSPPTREPTADLPRGEPRLELAPIELAPTQPAPIELAPIVILVPAPVARAAPHAPRSTRARSLEEMRCSDWRPLTMGGGAVRVCE